MTAKPETVVVDSSVIVKWLNRQNEHHLDQADALLTQALTNDLELLAPELSKYEVGNVLLLRKQLSRPHAADVFRVFYKLPIQYVPENQPLAQTTYQVASRYGLTYYDAAFIALAQRYRAMLVTDNPKHQAKAKKEVNVISLRDYA